LNNTTNLDFRQFQKSKRKKFTGITGFTGIKSIGEKIFNINLVAFDEFVLKAATLPFRLGLFRQKIFVILCHRKLLPVEVRKCRMENIPQNFQSTR
jgi:hypothetical protein